MNEGGGGGTQPTVALVPASMLQAHKSAPAQVAMLSEAGPRRVASFSWDRIVDAYETLFKHVIEPDRARDLERVVPP